MSEHMMPINDHNREEWPRMARAAYASGRPAVGRRFSDAATRRELPIREFDSLQHIPRVARVRDLAVPASARGRDWT